MIILYEKTLCFRAFNYFFIYTLICFAGCNKPTGNFYSLEKSYEKGYITVEQLQEIADYHNDGKDCPTPLDDKIANAIKETAAADTRKFEKYVEVKTSEFKILHYYGYYGNYYIVMIYNPYINYPDVVVDEWIDVGGVQFHITTHESIQVWVQD
ncbi:MAG: hypothetical protein ACI4QN_01420 [Candidatus Coproplasma sp.]